MVCLWRIFIGGEAVVLAGDRLGPDPPPFLFKLSCILNYVLHNECNTSHCVAEKELWPSCIQTSFHVSVSSQHDDLLIACSSLGDRWRTTRSMSWLKYELGNKHRSPGSICRAYVLGMQKSGTLYIQRPLVTKRASVHFPREAWILLFHLGAWNATLNAEVWGSGPFIFEWEQNKNDKSPCRPCLDRAERA